MKKSLGAKTIAYPAPVFIVGSYDAEDKPNAMNAAWGGICCSAPPCVNVSIRKARQTYENIMIKKAFTINIPSAKYVKEADYFGIATGKNVNKFEATSLTPVRSELVDAPYIEEFPLVIECKLLQSIELGIHTQFIGQIMDVKIDESMHEDGIPNLEKLDPIIFAPALSTYWNLGEKLGKAYSLGSEINN